MKNKDQDIDRYFRERLVGFEQHPPEASWEIIAGKLGHDRKKTFTLLFFRIAAGMAILISTGIGYYLLTKSAAKPEQAIMPINQHDTAPNHMSRLNRPVKRIAATPTPRQSSHSSRLEPARHVYTSPLVSAKIMNPLVVVPDAVGISGQADNNRQDLALAKIDNDYKNYLLTANLPAVPDFSLINKAATPEATAQLIPEYEEPDAVEKVKQNRWSLGSEVAPLYSYRSTSSDKLQADKLNYLNDNESGLLAYAGGLHVAFSAGRRLSVQSGIYYSRYGQEKNNVATYATNYPDYNEFEATYSTYIAVTNSTGVIAMDQPYQEFDIMKAQNTDMTSNFNSSASLNSTNKLYMSQAEETDITLTQYFDYLEVPLLVRYKVIDRKLDLSFSGGVVTNFLIGNTVNMEQNGKKSRFGETTEINQINYQGSFGMGFEYPITADFAFTIEPRFRYYINAIDKSPLINVHPYSFGFFAGFNYVF
jgi:hypothetical protein